MCATCGRSIGHSSRCPEYVSESIVECFLCGSTIDIGSEYVRSEVGNVCHLDCFCDMDRDQIFDFFGEDGRVRILERRYPDDD